MIRLEILPLLLYLALNLAPCSGTKKCSVQDLRVSVCEAHETCVEKGKGPDSGVCECLPGYQRSSEDSACEKLGDDGGSGAGHVTAIALFSLFLVIFVIAAVYYGRKYKMLSWLRHKVNQRYGSNYDDVMIGQDDD